MSVLRKLLFFNLLLCSHLVMGQGAPSPFSTFGIGEPYGSALVYQQGMAGVGIATPQYWFLNNQNPALLTYNSTTLFSAGILYESRTISGDTTKEFNKGGNMNYLAMAFPIRPRDVTKPLRWTTSIGLMPFTNVAYRLAYLEGINGTEDEEVVITQEGSGGFSQFYWSNGYRVNRKFSLGLKAAYIFGPINNEYSNGLKESDQTSPYLISVKEKLSAHDFMFEAGFVYRFDSLFSGKKHSVTIGGTYGFGNDLKVDQQVVFSRLDLINPDAIIDSLTLIKEEGLFLTIPENIGIGVSIANSQKWMIGIDFRTQDWTKFKGVSIDEANATNAWRLAIGGEYTPDLFSVDNVLERTTYRIGSSVERSPFLVNGKQVMDFGINFGFSVPAGRSSLDFAFRMGKRGNKAENILEENYFKVYFGLTLNDQWFIKRKFD